MTIRDGDDFFGIEVNLACADRAAGGQALVFASLHEPLSAKRAGRFGKPVEVQLKGLSGRHRVFAVS